MWSARRDARGALTDFEEPAAATPRYAFLGARSCELHAMGILDRVLLHARDSEPDEHPFVIAVNCGQAGGTCFCVSLGTGPVADRGYDLALTEVLDDGRHYLASTSGPRAAPKCSTM